MSDSSVPSVAVAAPTLARVNTLWIWLLLGVPFLWLVIGATMAVPIVVSEVSRAAQPTAGPPPIALLGLVVWIGLVVCAYLDERDLKRRLDLYKPFPWGWAFLSTLIYVIGRSVVVIRQTDRGRAPLWGAIVYVVASVVIVIVVTSIAYSAVTGR